MEKFRTCGECEFVMLYKNSFFTTTYCGKTGSEKDGLIVLHKYDGEDKTITHTRVPEFCTNVNTVISKNPAPKKYWKIIDVRI